MVCLIYCEFVDFPRDFFHRPCGGLWFVDLSETLTTNHVPVVAISNDDTGISEDPDVRFDVAKKIVERAADFGIPAHDIVVDPLVMPIGAMGTAGKPRGPTPGANDDRGLGRGSSEVN